MFLQPYFATRKEDKAMEHERITECARELEGVEWYRERIVEIIERIHDETMLKKIYTVSKTLKDLSR